MKKVKIWALCMIAAVVSFLGFVVENLWMAVTQGCMNNRSMLFPFLLGYGIAILLIYLILGTPRELCILGKKIEVDGKMKRILIYLAGVMICVSLGEILLGTFVEKVCGFIWWDYTRLPLHITRYTSIPTSFGFGSLITLFMNFFFDPLLHFFESWNETALKYTALTLVVIMTGDFLYAAYRMFVTHGTVIRWEILINSRIHRKIKRKVL